MSSVARRKGRPRLSVAMIVRNEAGVIAGSLESVQEIADEIVVLDTGSSDATCEIAGRCGARLSRAPWTDDFAAARNRCLELVQGDWVLWLDAGEQLDPASATALRNFVQKQARPSAVYLLMVELPPQPGASSEQTARLRLMPRRDDLRFSGKVGETLKPAAAAAGLSIELAPGRLVRHLRSNDPEWKTRRAQRNFRLITQAAARADGHCLPLLLALGEAYMDLGKRDAARQTYLETVKASPRGSTEMLEAYYGLLAALEGAGQTQLQLTTCLDALEAFPLDAQLLLAMGHYLQANGQPELAVRSFEAAVKFGQVDLESWHLRDLPETASACLGLSLQLQSRHDEAYRVFHDALAQNQESARLRRHLIELLVKRGESEEAVQLVAQCPLAPAQRAALADAIRGAAAAHAGQWTEAVAYLESAHHQGCHDVFCLRWLAGTLMCQGQFAAAEPIVRQWLADEAGDREARAYLAVIDAHLRPEQSHSATPRLGLLPRWKQIPPPAVALRDHPALLAHHKNAHDSLCDMGTPPAAPHPSALPPVTLLPTPLDLPPLPAPPGR